MLRAMLAQWDKLAKLSGMRRIPPNSMGLVLDGAPLRSLTPEI